MSEKFVAVMQPYLFPYHGYFQLIHAADTFVFYDDVAFSHGSWVNRNRILINGRSAWFTIPCRRAGAGALICDMEHALRESTRSRLLKTLAVTYHRAPYFDTIYPMAETVLRYPSPLLADLAIESVRQVSELLGLQTEFRVSSVDHAASRGSGRAGRLADITRSEGGSVYVNLPGGRTLYNASHFDGEGVELRFLDPADISYRQFGEPFVKNLSVLDLLMFNRPEEVCALIGQYRLSPAEVA